MKLLSGIQELLTVDPSAVNAGVNLAIKLALTAAEETTILEELDTKIAPLITEESELKDEITEAEDTRAWHYQSKS